MAQPELASFGSAPRDSKLDWIVATVLWTTSDFLLQTRITCRYSVKPKAPRRVKKSESAEAKAATPAPAPAAAVGQNPRALLVLKTVDTSSGVCLKYKTNKAAEVSRLVQLLGQLSRRQAGLISGAASAEEQEDVAMAEAGEAADAAAAAEPTPAVAAPAPAAPQSGGGGKGKKKKSKR